MDAPNLFNATGGRTGHVVLIFLSMIAPGFLMVFLFRPGNLASYDVLKVLIFSTSLGAPCVLFNMGMSILVHLYGAIRRSDHLRPDQVSGWIFRFGVESEVITISAIYPSLWIAYTFRLTFASFAVTLLIADLIALLFIAKLESTITAKIVKSEDTTES